MTSPALVGTVLDGKFRIDKALASGASGDVYEALHLGLGSPVAVKVLRPGFPETAHVRRKRFVREARVAARIQSDHVVRVFDIVAPDEGLIYIVMELLQGETLADRLRRVGAMAPAEAVGYLLQAAKPLARMHDEGIVHRDVKPSNVFLARDADGKERIKLLDFGIAAFQQPIASATSRARGESAITFTDAMIGTPRYMAPEQVRDSKQVDARADVWALGVTLYELLAGAPAFDGQTVLAVLSQIEGQEPRQLAERQPGVAPELARVVHRCLAKDPASRPKDARAFAEALAPFAGEAPARRPSDPVDLSLSDENVEVMRVAAPARTPRTKTVVAVAVMAGVIATLLFAATRKPAAAHLDETTAAPKASPTAPTADPAIASAAVSAPLASSVVTIEPMHDDTPARRAAEITRPTTTTRPRPKSPAHGPPKSTHPEDDDRLE